jgi:hypothetical protein
MQMKVDEREILVDEGGIFYGEKGSGLNHFKR